MILLNRSNHFVLIQEYPGLRWVLAEGDRGLPASNVPVAISHRSHDPQQFPADFPRFRATANRPIPGNGY